MTRTVGGRRPGLGYEPDPDPNDALFPMELVLALDEPLVEAPLPAKIYYNTGPILNQGSYPMCVGYSWRQWLTTGLVENTNLNPTGRTIYCEARTRDPWSGDCSTDLKSGTSIRAGAKYLQERGLITTYVWAWDAETVRRWLLSGKGPVVVGTRWYSSMYRPAGGRIVVNTNSTLAGGHAYALTGFDDTTKLFRVTNSWGTSWGTKGHSNMRYIDLDKLLKMQGECVTAVEIDRDVFQPQTALDIEDILENNGSIGSSGANDIN